jgi:hypothetical protein
MRYVRLSVALAIALAGGSASAQSLSTNLGTTGVGIEAGYGLDNHFALRGGYGVGSYDYTYTESDIRYDAKLDIGVGLFTADWHPFGGVFRISAGLGLNNTKVDGTADAVNGTITINGQQYTTSEVGTVQGNVKFDKSAPYLGFGWGNRAGASGGLFFTSDFGLVFSKASGSVTGTCAPSLNPMICTQLQNDLDAESQSFLREVEKVKYYPVARVGFGYRF